MVFSASGEPPEVSSMMGSAVTWDLDWNEDEPKAEGS